MSSLFQSTADLNEIKLFLGPVASDNEAAFQALKRIPGVEVSAFEVETLAKYVLLPYINTKDGRRYYGVSTIESFVNRAVGEKG